MEPVAASFTPSPHDTKWIVNFRQEQFIILNMPPHIVYRWKLKIHSLLELLLAATEISTESGIIFPVIAQLLSSSVDVTLGQPPESELSRVTKQN